MSSNIEPSQRGVKRVRPGRNKVSSISFIEREAGRQGGRDRPVPVPGEVTGLGRGALPATSWLSAVKESRPHLTSTQHGDLT